MLPSAIGAEQISQLISNPSVEEILSQGRRRVEEDLSMLGLELSETTVPAGSRCVGQPLSEVEFHKASGFLLVALIRKDGDILKEPPPETVLAEGDRLVFVTRGGEAPELHRKVQEAKQKLQYRGSSA